MSEQHDTNCALPLLHVAAVQSGEVIVRKDGQVDERSKAVKRGEVLIKGKH